MLCTRCSVSRRSRYEGAGNESCACNTDLHWHVLHDTWRHAVKLLSMHDFEQDQRIDGRQFVTCLEHLTLTESMSCFCLTNEHEQTLSGVHKWFISWLSPMRQCDDTPSSGPRIRRAS